MSRSRTARFVGAGLALSLGLAGCAHKNESQPQTQTQTQSSSPAKSSSSGSSSSATTEAAPAAKPIPKGHIFGKITTGMSDSDVRKILGEPTDRRDYVTGKAFIPYYYGSDTSRSDWIYKGKGHIVFSRNRWNGALSVIEVLYDPNAS
ncbi:MAG TPA: hypothetical protein VMR50_06240 [Myxococcota bacterium]|nr:hypothetical protein [Myxococcota bacterium]